MQVIHAKPPPAAAHHLRRPPPKPPSTARSSNPSSAAPVSSPRECCHCGSKTHLANDRSCPAASAQCNNCQKMRYYLPVCRSGQARSVHEAEIDLTCLKFRSFSLSDKIRALLSLRPQLCLCLSSLCGFWINCFYLV